MAVMAAGSLGLGTSALTVTIGIIKAVYFAPLPYPDPGSLVAISVFDRIRQGSRPFSEPEAAVIASAKALRSTAFAGLTDEASIGDVAFAGKVVVAAVTPNYFDVLGVRPLLGRTLVESDEVATITPILISADLWQSHFASDTLAVGRQILLDGKRAIIVGVIPDAVRMPPAARVWRPIRPPQLGSLAEAGESYAPIARLVVGASPDAAGAELLAILRNASPNSQVLTSTAVRVSPIPKIRRDAQSREVDVWIGVSIVLALLCALNFATMILANGATRHVELATRSALGATAASLSFLLISEAAVIATAGAATAVVLAQSLSAVPRALLGAGLGTVVPAMTPEVALLGFVATLVIGTAFALPPAIQLSRDALRASIGAGMQVTSIAVVRGRRNLVALQLAFAIASVAIVAGLFSAMRRSLKAGLGYDYSRIIAATMTDLDSRDRISELAITSYAEETPGVQAAAIVRGLHPPTLVRVSPRDIPAVENHYDVSPSFFVALGLQPLEGRLPTETEMRARAPVVLASVATARWFRSRWGSSPVGHRAFLSVAGSPPAWYTFVGVIPDVHFWPDFDPVMSANFTVQDRDLARADTRLIVRTRSNTIGVLNLLRTRLSKFDPRLEFTDITLVSEQVRMWLAPFRARLSLVAFIGFLATALAIVGVFGLTSYTVAVQSRELGIRLALGATVVDLALVLAKDFGLAGLVGVLAGVVLGYDAIALFSPPDPLLSDVSLVKTGAALLAPSVATLVLVGALGTVVPLRRAMSLDVARTLQSR